MSTVMLLIGMSAFPGSEHEGRYLVECDVDARAGRGRVFSTADKTNAMQFENTGAAMEYWRRQSKIRPFRDELDGLPNRPLTAYTVTFEEV